MAGYASLGWIAVGLAGVALLAPHLGTLSKSPDAPIGAAGPVGKTDISTGTIGNGIGAVTIDRAPDSHFYAEAQVNGVPVRFMVDTGASSVVLTREDALRAGIGAGDYSATGIGAGGTLALMPVRISRLALGPLVADNVPAMVAKDELPVSLLGQTFLSRASSMEISGDRLVLR